MEDYFAYFILLSYAAIPLALALRGVPIRRLFENDTLTWRIIWTVTTLSMPIAAIAYLIAEYLNPGSHLQFAGINLMAWIFAAFIFFFWARCIYLLLWKPAT
jgi:hypothetical protein